MEQTPKSKKNMSIELMRYLMIVAVAVLHFDEDFSVEKRTLRGGALGVDFFFLIGGFFLAQHYYRYQSKKTPAVQANQYFVGRLKRLYPAYLISLIVINLIYFFEHNFSIQWLLKHLYQTKWQYIFGHLLVPGMMYDLRSIWYLSPFVFVSWLLYFMLAYNDKLAMGIFPVTSLVIFTHIYATYGTINIPLVWEGWIGGGTLRAFAEMGLGAFVYGNVRYCYENNIIIESNSKRTLVTVLKWISLLLIVLLMRRYSSDDNDFFKIVLIVLFVRLSYCNCYSVRIKAVDSIVGWLGSINYWIFSIHLIISRLIVKFFHMIEYRYALVMYLASITIVASLCQCMENWIRRKKYTNIYQK